MNPVLIGSIITAYFLMLIGVSYLTGRKSDNATFFLGNRKSPWYVVAIGMIGASLSGVTFVSVPGMVGASSFTYMQMVLGFLLGYVVIANVLLPLFYRMNLTSIYGYLEHRFGVVSYKTGALLFFVSKLIGAAARLYLMASVLQLTLFDALHVPFGVTVTVTIALIWAYTFRGGMKTIIWTDMLQAILMIAAVVLTFVLMMNDMGWSMADAIGSISESSFSKVFVFDDWSSTQNFWKQFFSGAFITIVMTGLDQDMMQKNLTCRSLSESKKNMYWYSFAFVPVNLIFLGLGALLLIYASHHGIALPERADEIFPKLATGGFLPASVGILFMLGLVAAAYSSADSAMAALTTSFSIDILGIEKRDERDAVRIRRWVHVGIAVLMGLLIVALRVLHLDTIINTIYTIAGYTYGPLLGLFAFGLTCRVKPRDYLVPLAAIVPPVLVAIIDWNSQAWWGVKLGYEKLMLNGLLVYLLLWLLSVGHPQKR